jgi:spore maturation protein A
MVTFLAINTASVQILPPVLLIALMGLQINQLVIPIILATGLSLVVAITAAKLYEKLPGSRASDPEAKSTPGEGR